VAAFGARLLRACQRISRYADVLSDSQPVRISGVLQPVIDADRFLRQTDSRLFTITIAANGTPVFTTVPDNEMWEIYSMHVTEVSGSYTSGDIYLEAADSSEPAWIWDQSFSTTPQLLGDDKRGFMIPLNPGDKVGTGISGYVSTGTMELRMWLVVTPLEFST